MGRREGSLRARGPFLQLDYYFKGERLRPTTHYLATNKAQRAEAERLLATINLEIARGTHNPATYFPDYPKAKKYRRGSHIRIKDALRTWLMDAHKRLAKSTLRDYESGVYHYLIPTFGDLYLSELDPALLRQFIAGLTISNQRINNVLIPLRCVCDNAFADELIDRNPFERIRGLPREDSEVDPFTRSEVESILRVCEGQVLNILTFGFFTGLRTSELIGLRWKDVSSDNTSIYVRHTRTRTETRNRTKTSAGVRQVKLLPHAKSALKRQQAFTIGKDYVFDNPRTGEPWKHDGPLRKTAWIPALVRAGTRYRKPYAMRHTYASMLLSAGESPMWVAQQMGHKDWGMIRKVYGRWIPDSAEAAGEKIARLWSQDGPKTVLSG